MFEGTQFNLVVIRVYKAAFQSKSQDYLTISDWLQLCNISDSTGSFNLSCWILNLEPSAGKIFPVSIQRKSGPQLYQEHKMTRKTVPLKVYSCYSEKNGPSQS